MYNCLYKFLETNNMIYILQFGFRQKHSRSHALIHLTDKIREQLVKGNFACSIFADIKKLLILLIIRFLFRNWIIMA